MTTHLFGSITTAMVTPFDADGELDLAASGDLAEFLTRDGWNDGLIVNGTTGEASTTSDAEKADLISAVVERVGDRVRITAGVGTADTRHSIRLAEQAAERGAHGLLVVTPYYSKPSQRGILEHLRAIADATDLPVMLYDIPGRSVVPLSQDTIVAAAEHPKIVALKDAKGDLEAASWVLRETDLAVYSGEDALNLPLLSIGATGFVSVAGHIVADRLRLMRDAYLAGEVARAAELHRELLPVYRGIFRIPGLVSAKAALTDLGIPASGVRRPLLPITPEEHDVLRADLRAAGVITERVMR